MSVVALLLCRLRSQLVFAFSCLKALSALHHWPLRLNAHSLDLVPWCNRTCAWLYHHMCVNLKQ